MDVHNTFLHDDLTEEMYMKGLLFTFHVGLSIEEIFIQFKASPPIFAS